MFASLPMYQRQGKAAYKADLSYTLALARLTENPEKFFKSIHIAGTNGKGSTSHMLASVLQEAGFKTGLYTSPHLVDFRERIRVNGTVITKEAVVDFYSKYSSKWAHIQPSFFEITVLMAFDYFRAEKIDIAVLETGMGGRLDSTNIVTPEISVITNIGLDHTQFLGNTIPKIAGEKAGIIKSKKPVVTGKMLEAAFEVINRVATQKNAPLFKAETTESDYKTDLKGDFQKENLSTVLKTIEVLNAQGNFIIPEQAIKTGLLKVQKKTGLRGRFEQISSKPKIIIDGAHNEAGIKLLMQELRELNYSKLHIVWSMVSDKNAEETFRLLPKDAHYYLCQSSVPRAMDLKQLLGHAQAIGLLHSAHFTVKDALAEAKKSASGEDLILATGSFFTVADVLSSGI